MLNRPRVTFLEPPVGSGPVPERFAGCSYELYHFPDLANLFPFTQLANEGVEVRYLDAALEGMGPQAFSRWLAADDSTHYVLHGVILSKPADLAVLGEIGRLRPGAEVIVHGPEPTRVPDEYLGVPGVKVIRGEIEATLPTYLREGRLDGISYRNGSVRHGATPRDIPFDDLPIPTREHPAVARYLRQHRNPKFRVGPYTILLASRGCAFRCNYCVPIAISFARELEVARSGGAKPPVKVGSAARVVEEMRYLHRLGFRSAMFMDDQFLWAKRRTLEICQGVAPLGMAWGCLSRADLLTDDEVVGALADAGCKSIDIGVESLDQAVLDAIEKDLKVADVPVAVANLRRHRIEPKINIMFGTTPRETEDGIRATVEALCEMDVDRVMFTIATPFKGTPFYDRAKADGTLLDDTDSINPLGKAVIGYPHLPPERLEALGRYAYRRFYLRPRIAWRRLRSARSVGDILHDARIAAKVLLQG